VIVAADLGVAIEQVNVKATTSEGLGFTGREEGIAANAVVTLVSQVS
jgi:2-C-methyl-D-erythritol 2,4-cyclodiphosphate synthase